MENTRRGVRAPAQLGGSRHILTCYRVAGCVKGQTSAIGIRDMCLANTLTGDIPCASLLSTSVIHM